MKQIFDRNEYRKALMVANACNPRGVTHSLQRLAITAALHYPNDAEFVGMVDAAATISAAYDGPTDGIWLDEQYSSAVKWLYDHTWQREYLWQIGSDPAIALHIQALGNIMVNAVGHSMSREAIGRYGIADSGLYSLRVKQAEIMAFAQQLRITGQPVDMVTLSLSLDKGEVRALDNEWVCSQLLVEFFSDRFVGGARVIRAETCDVVVGQVVDSFDFVREVITNRTQVQFPIVFEEVDYE